MRVTNYIKKILLIILKFLLIRVVGKNRVERIILNPLELAALKLVREDALRANGWAQSWTLKQSVDRFENPVPWLNLSFNRLFDSWDISTCSLLEIGGGNSSLFFAGKCRRHVVVEDDLNWCQRINNKLNIEVIEGDFNLDVINEKFDLVIVDNIGNKRKENIYPASKCLTPRGVLVLDDSEREEYFLEIEKLVKDGFKRLDIWGLGIGLNYDKCTTLFYRDDNIFGV